MLVSREEARENGLKHYFTGVACAKGHIEKRFVSSNECMECRRASSREYRERNLEERRKKCKEWYDAHKGSEEFLAAYRARNQKWASKNKEKVKTRTARWRKNNPERSKIIGRNARHKRRAGIRGGAGVAKMREWAMQQKKVCYWCGTKCGKSWEIDHYTPLSRGGDHLIDNFVIACRTCNARKGPRDPYVFAAQVGRLF